MADNIKQPGTKKSAPDMKKPDRANDNDSPQDHQKTGKKGSQPNKAAR